MSDVVLSTTLANHFHAGLLFFLGLSLWRGRELQHGGSLIDSEIVELDDRAVRKLQRIVVRMGLVLVHLTENADVGRQCAAIVLVNPVGANWGIEGNLRPRKDADGYLLTIRRAEAAGAGAEVGYFELVGDSRRSRGYRRE